MDIRSKNRTLLCLLATGAVLLTVLFFTLAASRVGAEPTVADLSTSSMSVDHAEAPLGAELLYTIVISNSGDSTANGVNITNTLPADTELKGVIGWPNDSGVISETQSYTNSVVTWGGLIGSGSKATLQYTVLISDSADISSTITNSAEITHNAITSSIKISTTTFVLPEAEDSTIYLPIMSLAGQAPTVSASSVSKSGNDYRWTISWQLEDAVANARFVIQESDTPDFTNILNERTQDDFSELYTRPASFDNLYYYRVRLDSSAGSPWSEPVRVINAFHDNFSDTGSGWKIVRQDLDDTDNSVVYRQNDGVLLVDTGGRWDYTVASSLRPVVDGDYQLKTRVVFAGPGNLNTYGFILGGDWNGDRCPTLYDHKRSADVADFETEPELVPWMDAPTQSRAPVIDNCFNHYYRIMLLWNGDSTTMQLQVKRIDFHDAPGNSGRGPEHVSFIPVKVSSNNTNGWNEWTVEVRRSGNFKLFAGNDKVAEWNDNAYTGDSYWGLWSSTDEYPGSDPLFDYVTIEPLE